MQLENIFQGYSTETNKIVKTPSTAESNFNTFTKTVSFQQVEQLNQLQFLKPLSFIGNNHEYTAQIIPFQIKIDLISNNIIKKSTLMKVHNMIENCKKLKLLLSNLYDRIVIQYAVQYQIKIYVILDSGFERILYNDVMKINHITNKIIFIPSQNSQVQLVMQIEENDSVIDVDINYLIVPLQSIQAVQQQQQRLINKSQQLNTIQHLYQLKGIYYQLSKQNMGSRILQKLMNKATMDQIYNLSKQLNKHHKQLIIHKYGNYVFQKLVELTDNKGRNEMVKNISNDIVTLLCSKAGTHSLQKMIEWLDNDGLMMIVNSICNHVILLSKDQFGTHFIQKFLRYYPQYNLLNTLMQHFQQLSCDKYGIVVLKCILPICNQHAYLRCSFYHIAMTSFTTVVYHQYGHYIIEEILQYYSVEQLKVLFQYILFYLIDISQNVYSSNVLRKGLQIFQNIWADAIIVRLLEVGLLELMETKSGSFVLHRVLDSHSIMKTSLIKQMHLRVLEINNYQRRNKWKKYFNIS